MATSAAVPDRDRAPVPDRWARRILVALGGNAMSAPDGSATETDQIAALGVAAGYIADLVAAGFDVAITHGNGPQVGNLLVKNEIAAGIVPPVSLDWCGANTQGTVGFVLQNALARAFAQRGIDRPTAAIVTRTLVSANDPAFLSPDKPVGRFRSREEAAPLMEAGQNWRDFGERGWRRVVPSPKPVAVIDAPTGKALADLGYIVILSGGGGIPVVARDAAAGQGRRDEVAGPPSGARSEQSGTESDAAAGQGRRDEVAGPPSGARSEQSGTVGDGGYDGVEAVIDKDRAAAILAPALGADTLVIATDVPAAVIGFGTPDARPLGHVSLAEMQGYLAEGHFGAGSMGPKVEAACSFVETGGSAAVITSLDRLGEVFTSPLGAVGTVITSASDAVAGQGRRDGVAGPMSGARSEQSNTDGSS